MADETRDHNACSIAASGNGSHCSDSPHEIKQAAETIDGVDFINSMPDEILHSILYFLPTLFAIRTSALSRRWRHVWCETPCLDFNEHYDARNFMMVGEINQTLNSYTASKIKRFHLCMETERVTKPQIDSWIEFAISRNVEKLSLNLSESIDYCFPDFFYLSSFLEKLSVDLMFPDMFPKCTVSWKSLRKLTLSCCNLNDESIANILSGSPVLGTLILDYCMGLERLDLSKLHSLSRLEIDNDDEGPTEIVAPYICYFSLISSAKPCTLVDVSFLKEASLDIYILQRYYDDGVPLPYWKAEFLQTSMLNMLTKLQNVERLTLGGTLLQIISLAELRGVSFPTFKVQTLTVKTKFVRSFIPGITRLLQNSPGLKKLIVEETKPFADLKDMDVDSYLDSLGLNPVQCWRSKYEVFPTSIEFDRMLGCGDITCKLVASFIEMVLRNVPTLEMLVLGSKYIDRSFSDAKWFEELLLPTLSNNNNVSIVLKR